MGYVEVDKLSVLIEAQAGQFKREIAELQRLTKQAGSGMTGSFIKANIASQVLVGTFKKLGNASFNMGKKLVDLGSQYSRLKIATDTVARNMGMSVSQVNDLRTALEDANTYGSQAENTIKTLALSGLIDMANSLEYVDSRNGEAVQGVNALVLAMKDLGAAAGIDSAEAIDRVTKFVRRGEIAMADGIIEVGNMNMEYREYAKTLGKTYTELTQEELAQARLNIVMREAGKTLGTYANTMQTSGKAIDSIGNVITSLYERLGNYLEPVFASVTRAVFEFVDSVRSALIGNEATFRSWANNVAAYVIAVVRIIGTLLTRIPVVGKYFEGLTHFSLKPVVATMDKLSNSTSGTAGAIEDATSGAKALKKELLGLAGFDEMNVLSQPEEGGTVGGGVNVGGAGIDLEEMMNVEELNKNIDDINKRSDEITKEMLDKIGKIKEALKPLIDFLRPIGEWFWNNKETILKVAGAFLLVKIAVEQVIKVFGIFMGVKSVITTIVTAVKGLISIVGTLIATGAIVPVLIGVLIGLIAYATYLIIKNWDEVKARIAEIWENIKETFEKGSEKIKEIWGNVTDWLTERWEGFSNWWKEGIEAWKLTFSLLGESINNTWSNVTNWISGKWNTVTDWIKERINNIGSAFSGLGDKIRNVWDITTNWISAKWTGTVDWIKNKINDIGSTFSGFGDRVSGIWNKIKDDAVSAFNTLKSKLTGIFDNIGSGISNSFEQVVNRLKWLINTFVINPLNSARLVINMIPGVDIKKIPPLATGGVIDSPTVALLGEAGSEAVVPLENNTEWIDKLADKIGQGGQPINITVKLGEDTIYQGFIDYINDRSLASGTKLLKL